MQGSLLAHCVILLDFYENEGWEPGPRNEQVQNKTPPEHGSEFTFPGLRLSLYLPCIELSYSALEDTPRPHESDH